MRTVVRSLFVAVAAVLLAAPTMAQDNSATEGTSKQAELPRRVKDRSKLKKRGAVTCAGTDDTVVENALIETDGDAVILTGSCDITIRKSVIVAGGNGLVIRGSGDITLEGSDLTAQKDAITIMGSGDVEVSNSTIVSAAETAVRITGSGDVELESSILEGKVVKVGTGDFSKDEASKLVD